MRFELAPVPITNSHLADWPFQEATDSQHVVHRTVISGLPKVTSSRSGARAFQLAFLGLAKVHGLLLLRNVPRRYGSCSPSAPPQWVKKNARSFILDPPCRCQVFDGCLPAALRTSWNGRGNLIRMHLEAVY